MKDKIRIGVMGAYRGIALLKAMIDHPQASIVAVCDKYEPSLKKAAAVAKEHGVELALYREFDEFIAGDLDAVVLANYAHEHAIFAIRALRAGKHVLSEVLPCNTIAQGIELIEAVEETGLVYAYAENYCYMQHHFEMWHRVKSGEIGEINYAEGEYIHDCTSIQPSITYGDPEHWRNNASANYYCTHSLGPMLMAIGKRPVRVVGYELPEFGRGGHVPARAAGAGIQMVTLENGAVCRSINGWLRREGACNINYMYYGDLGMMETGRFADAPMVNVYHEGDRFCQGTWERFDPEPRISLATTAEGHMGSDSYAPHFFIQKILGRPEGKEWSIDVYQAVEMGLCGLLAHRSVLNGNQPMEVPNFRNKAERDAYRNDVDTTFPDTEGGRRIPQTLLKSAREPDAQYYEYIRSLWQEDKNFEEYPY